MSQEVQMQLMRHIHTLAALNPHRTFCSEGLPLSEFFCTARNGMHQQSLHRTTDPLARPIVHNSSCSLKTSGPFFNETLGLEAHGSLGDGACTIFNHSPKLVNRGSHSQIGLSSKTIHESTNQFCCSWFFEGDHWWVLHGAAMV